LNALKTEYSDTTLNHVTACVEKFGERFSPAKSLVQMAQNGEMFYQKS